MIETENDPRVPGRRLEDPDNHTAFKIRENIPHPLGLRRRDGKDSRRRAQSAQAFRTLRQHPVEDRMQERHALDGNAACIEQAFGTIFHDAGLTAQLRHAGYAAWADCEPPDTVSFSTVSIDGRSCAEMVLRPCSSAICGMAPFIKASKVCLTMM